MKLFSKVFTLALVAEAIATPAKKDWSKLKGPVDGLLLPPEIAGPQSQYAIGKKAGKFAEVDGRLIVLNGKKQYFSGNICTFSVSKHAHAQQVPMLGG